MSNRICFPAHRTNFAREGRLTDRHISYFSRRAKGGVGLIIVGEISIHPNDRPWDKMITAHNQEVVRDYKKLTEAVHVHGTAVFAQLTHHGFQSNGAITREAVWGPSAVADVAFGETAKAMEPEDISELTESFAEAAVFAREGGFDGVEIDMGPESILRQFFSPISNMRKDSYGGDLENRMRFPLDVIHAVRRAVGNDFTVGIGLCANEKFWGAITLDDSKAFAKRVESAGDVDFIRVTVGTYYNLHLCLASMHTESCFAIDDAEEIHNSVNIPVIAGHKIDFPEMAEDILAQGRADAISLTRQLITDPDAPRKVKEGRLEDVRYCIRDNKGCVGRLNQSKDLSCIQNPEVGYEDKKPALKKSATVKRVLIVGAGPAGLEAGRMAREKGHEVIVYEKEPVIGGQVNLAAKGAGRAGVKEVIRYLGHTLDQLGVPVFTGKAVTAEEVLSLDPDVVIIATGSRPVKNPVPGSYGPPLVQNVWEVLMDRFPINDRVLFIDENGGHHSTATVEALADQGKRVDILTNDLFVGVELAPGGDLYLTRQRLLQKGVRFITDVVVDEINDLTVKARNIYTNDPAELEGYSSIVLDMGNEVNDELYKELKGRVKTLYRIGDCVAPRGMDVAIFEGRKIGEEL